MKKSIKILSLLALSSIMLTGCKITINPNNNQTPIPVITTPSVATPIPTTNVTEAPIIATPEPELPFGEPISTEMPTIENPLVVDQTEELDLGTWYDTVYTNKSLGIEFTLPSSWKNDGTNIAAPDNATRLLNVSTSWDKIIMTAYKNVDNKTLSAFCNDVLKNNLISKGISSSDIQESTATVAGQSFTKISCTSTYQNYPVVYDFYVKQMGDYFGIIEVDQFNNYILKLDEYIKAYTGQVPPTPLTQPSSSASTTTEKPVVVHDPSIIGTWEGNVYTNKYLGWKLTLPEGWEHSEQYEMKDSSEIGYSSNNHLLYLVQKSPFKVITVDFNTNPHKYSGKERRDSMKSLHSNLTQVVSQVDGVENVAGLEYHTLTEKYDYGTIEKNYFTTIGEYAINITNKAYSETEPVDINLLITKN